MKIPGVSGRRRAGCCGAYPGASYSGTRWYLQVSREGSDFFSISYGRLKRPSSLVAFDWWKEILNRPVADVFDQASQGLVALTLGVFPCQFLGEAHLHHVFGKRVKNRNETLSHFIGDVLHILLVEEFDFL